MTHRDTSVEFFIDKTAPDVMLGSVKNNETYDMAEKNVVLDVREKGLLTELVLCVNDKDYQEFSEEDLIDGQVTAKLKGDNSWQKLTVRAADAAGDKSVTEAVNILVTNDKAAQLIKNNPLNVMMEHSWMIVILMLLALAMIVMCVIAMNRLTIKSQV